MEKDKEYYRKKMFEIKLKIAFLPLNKRENLNHPYYQKLKEIKHKYAKCLFDEIEKEKEKEENDKYKRR